MNHKYEFNGDLSRGKKSAVAQQAFEDMMTDDCTIVHIDYHVPGRFDKVHRVLDERMVMIKDEEREEIEQDL